MKRSIEWCTCPYEGCDTTRNFGEAGGKAHTSRRFCAEHKKENMADVRKTTCEAAGCDTHPSYGIPGERPQFCSKHRENDMVDLINAVCKDPDCKKLATFG